MAAKIRETASSYSSVNGSEGGRNQRAFCSKGHDGTRHNSAAT